jgi:hypothetical protein
MPDSLMCGAIAFESSIGKDLRAATCKKMQMEKRM